MQVNIFHVKNLSFNDECPVKPHFIRSKVNANPSEIKAVQRLDTVDPTNKIIKKQDLEFKKDESCFLHMCYHNRVIGIIPSDKLGTPIKVDPEIKLNEFQFNALVNDGYIPIEENPKTNLSLLDILRNSYTDNNGEKRATFINNSPEFIENLITSGLFIADRYHRRNTDDLTTCIENGKSFDESKLNSNPKERHKELHSKCSIAARGIQSTDMVSLIRIIEQNDKPDSNKSNNHAVVRVITPYPCEHLYLLTNKPTANHVVTDQLIYETIAKNTTIEDIIKFDIENGSSILTNLFKYTESTNVKQFIADNIKLILNKGINKLDVSYYQELKHKAIQLLNTIKEHEDYEKNFKKYLNIEKFEILATNNNHIENQLEKIANVELKLFLLENYNILINSNNTAIILENNVKQHIVRLETEVNYLIEEFIFDAKDSQDRKTDINIKYIIEGNLGAMLLNVKNDCYNNTLTTLGDLSNIANDIQVLLSIYIQNQINDNLAETLLNNINIHNEGSNFFKNILNDLPERKELALENFDLTDKDPLLFIIKNREELNKVLTDISFNNYRKMQQNNPDCNHIVRIGVELTNIEFPENISNKLSNIKFTTKVYEKVTNTSYYSPTNKIDINNIINSSSIEEVINKLRIGATFAIITTLIKKNCQGPDLGVIKPHEGVWEIKEACFTKSKISLDDVYNHKTKILSLQGVLQDSFELEKSFFDNISDGWGVLQGDININDYYI